MKALITGATGFIGYHLVRALLSHDVEVACLVRRTSNTAWLDGLGVRFLYGDLRDERSLASAVRGFDWVFHLAGAVISVDRAGYFRTNTEGTRNITRAIIYHNPSLRRLVYVSSLAAGGPSRPDAPRSERMSDAPITHYGESKLAAERYLWSVSEHIPVSVVRPPSVYGPLDVAILPFFQAAARGLGIRFAGKDLALSLVYVEDLVRALVEVARHPDARGELFYVSDARGAYTLEQIQRTIAAAYHRGIRILPLPRSLAVPVGLAGEAVIQATGKPAFLNRQKIKEMTQPAWSCDSSKITHVVGHRPRYPLPDGAARTASWYRRHGWIR
jgi:nucleoside-diphosphate-sugar epimerase